LAGVGLIVAGLTIASLDLHPALHALQTYHSEIFYTNCLFLCTPARTQSPPTSPSTPSPQSRRHAPPSSGCFRPDWWPVA
jgi:hypothetical protein